MTLQQLRYFLATVSHGSFSGAADALRIAQPSLSEQVRRLERELGVELFARVGRGLALTEAGRTLRPHAERVLGALDEAREAVAQVREVRSGTVSMGMFGTAPYYLLGDVVAEFQRRHPEVRVRLVGQNSTEVADALRAGELEAALLVLPIDDTGLSVRPLLRDEILYASTDPERTRGPVTIEQVAAAPLIAYDARWGWQDPTRRQLVERAQRAGVSLDPRIEIEDVAAAVQIASRGLGDTFVARAVAGDARFPKRLRTVPFDPPLHDTLAIVTRRGGRLSPGVRELVALVEKRVLRLADGAPETAR